MHRSAVRDWEEPELLSDLPHNIELEQALLGALLISNASYHRVAPLVTPADFYEPLHGRLFEAIGDLVAKNSPATPLTLTPFFEGEMVGTQTVLNICRNIAAVADGVVLIELGDLLRRAARIR
jgi:replicative DNA helicase